MPETDKKNKKKKKKETPRIFNIPENLTRRETMELEDMIGDAGIMAIDDLFRSSKGKKIRPYVALLVMAARREGIDMTFDEMLDAEHYQLGMNGKRLEDLEEKDIEDFLESADQANGIGDSTDD